MPRIRYRYLLPFGHFLIDIICLISGILHIDAIRGRIKHAPSVIHPVMLQEAGSPYWDFRHDVPPVEEYAFLGLGNPAAFIVDVSLRPQGIMMPTVRGPRWDVWWLLIQESLAVPLWFAAGVYADSRGGRFAGWCRWFLITRLVLAVFLLAPGVARLGSLLEVIFWLVLIVGAFFRGIARLLSVDFARVSRGSRQ